MLEHSLNELRAWLCTLHLRLTWTCQTSLRWALLKWNSLTLAKSRLTRMYLDYQVSPDFIFTKCLIDAMRYKLKQASWNVILSINSKEKRVFSLRMNINKLAGKVTSHSHHEIFSFLCFFYSFLTYIHDLPASSNNNLIKCSSEEK